MSSGFPEGARRYREFLTEIFGRATVGDGGVPLPIPDPAPVSELEIQARWFAGEFGREFISTEGKPVRIVQFGHWNRSAGPDFTDTVVEISGEKRCGAIEIDLEAASWETHGHGANAAFDEVVLQVFLRHAGGEKFFTRNSQHREIAQLALDPELLIQRGTAWNRVPEARLGRCATPLRAMPADRIASLLTAAAQFRLMQKANRIGAIAEAHSENQALFQAVAEALGFRHNKIVMAVLAQRLPLKDLRSFEPLEREALLFGVAGFIGHEQFESGDAAARDYLKSLWDHWWKLRDAYEPEPEKSLGRRLSGARPMNHPQRRMGALSVLANHWKSFRNLLPGSDSSRGDWPKQMREHLSKLSHDYWQHHYTLRSKPSEKPMALIGKDRIQDILGNILFPLALREQPSDWEKFCDLPGSGGNESLRRASLRLFGEDHPGAADLSRKYWQQQGLLQIYRDFCLEDTSECAECPFPEQLSQWLL